MLSGPHRLIDAGATGNTDDITARCPVHPALKSRSTSGLGVREIVSVVRWRAAVDTAIPKSDFKSGVVSQLKQPSRAKYQQQKHGKEQQVNATLQDTRLAAAKTDHAHRQGEQEQWKIAAFDAERY